MDEEGTIHKIGIGGQSGERTFFSDEAYHRYMGRTTSNPQKTQHVDWLLKTSPKNLRVKFRIFRQAELDYA